MWKQLADLFTSVFTLAHRVDRLESVQREQQREIKEVTSLVNRLALELARTNDELRRTAEREREAREKFMLMVENQLLKAGRQLLPPNGSTRKRALLTRWKNFVIQAVIKCWLRPLIPRTSRFASSHHVRQN